MEVNIYSSALDRYFVADFIEEQDLKVRKKILRNMEMLERYGNGALKFLDVKKMRGGKNFWELRINCNKIAVRLFYVIRNGALWFVHGFVKKKQDTPLNHIETALERIRDLDQRVLFNKG